MRVIIITVALLGFAGNASADLRVFACEREWSELAKELGGEHVRADSATNALQDPHYIEARPSLIAKVRRADLVICSGAQLEVGWLPLLLGKANNHDVMPGTPGYIEASSLVTRLELPDSLDRSQGDMHPQGNPHIQGNPNNIAVVARVLSERLASLDSANAAEYENRLRDFLNRWKIAVDGWEAQAESLQGKRVVAHHKSWVYLEDWLGLEELATLEPVPGIPPTAGHLSKLVNQLRVEGSGADFIIRSPYQSDKASNWLAERTGIAPVMLPLTVGGSDGATDLFGLYTDILDRLLEALP